MEGMNEAKEVTEEKVAKAAAEEEFKRFARVWEIDLNIDAMSGEDRESFNQLKNRIINQVIAGNATIDDEGDICYTLKYPKGETKELYFRVPGGDAYLATDSYKERQGIHKTNAFMGAMTKQAPKLFANMDARDVKFCQAVANLFLGS